MIIQNNSIKMNLYKDTYLTLRTWESIGHTLKPYRVGKFSVKGFQQQPNEIKTEIKFSDLKPWMIFRKRRIQKGLEKIYDLLPSESHYEALFVYIKSEKTLTIHLHIYM